jgi:hypothetical protein
MGFHSIYMSKFRVSCNLEVVCVCVLLEYPSSVTAVPGSRKEGGKYCYGSIFTSPKASLFRIFFL